MARLTSLGTGYLQKLWRRKASVTACRIAHESTRNFNFISNGLIFQLLILDLQHLRVCPKTKHL